jgi:hypothetical protein
MTARRRYALLLVGGFFLLLVLIFQQIIIANVVLPVATLIWVLLRIFVFSIDQHVYWWLLIGVLLLVPLIRELRKTRPYDDPDLSTTSNPWLERVDSWRGSILADEREAAPRSRVRRDLAWLLAGLYATGRQQSADAEIKAALQTGKTDVPDALRAFLWPTERPPRPPFLKDPAGFVLHVMGSLRAAAVRLVRRLTGREAAEYYQAIELALAHLETSLEMRNDDTPYNP